MQLLTSHPPPSSAGVRFVSLGLCMLIACPSLIGQQEHEKRSIEWVQWLVREEAYFERWLDSNNIILCQLQISRNQSGLVVDGPRMLHSQLEHHCGNCCAVTPHWSLFHYNVLCTTCVSFYLHYCYASYSREKDLKIHNTWMSENVVIAKSLWTSVYAHVICFVIFVHCLEIKIV